MGYIDVHQAVVGLLESSAQQCSQLICECTDLSAFLLERSPLFGL